jgi:hypothetical protein
MLNGSKIEHLKNFKPGEEVFREEVDLMEGSGTVDKGTKYKFSFDYAIPKIGPKLNWRDIEDATFTVELDGGSRLTYSGVDCLSQGEMTIDGEKEAVMTITFIAGSKEED